MTEREQIVEALDEIENGMCRVAESHDIWQNKLVYSLCKAVRILLIGKLKSMDRKEN